MYTIREMKEIKEAYGLSYEDISKGSGVPISTVQKVFGGSVTRPRKATLEALSVFFTSFARIIRESGFHSTVDPMSDAGKVGMVAEYHPYGNFGTLEPGVVAEYHPYGTTGTLEPGVVAGSHPYGNPGTKGCSAVDITNGMSGGEIYTQTGYTYNDYCRLELPEGVWMEIYDGRLVKMASPSTVHQFIAGELFRCISNYIRINRGPCVPFIAPVDVRPEYREDGTDMTVLIPDVLVVCDRKKIAGMQTVNGAPDFVAEVLSPATRKYDMFEKLAKYRSTGVREYWVIDHAHDKVIKYDFEGENEIMLYTMRDRIPVGIYDGKLEIDFGEIREYMDSVFGENAY